MAFSNRDIRNVAIVGHGGTGKTTLFEQLLAIGGEIAQPAAVATGKSVSDFTPEEVEHGLSVHTALGHLVWNDTKINLLDTPGAAAFIGEVVPAFRATESALIVVGAKAGVQIETIKLWRRLNRRNMPRIVFVNKLDEDRADYDHVLDDLEHKFDKPVVPITVPVGQGSDFEGIVDLIANREMRPTGPTTPEELADIPDVYAATAAKYRERLVEAAAEGDDELTMKYLETEELTEAEIHRGIAEGLAANRVVPVFCGSAERNSGLAALLDVLLWAAPSPAGACDTAVDRDGNEREYPIHADGAFAALNFKTTIDQFSGKLSYVKIMGGTLRPNTEFVIDRDGKRQKAGKVYLAQGKKLGEVDELCAGDIGVIAKVADAHTNDTFHAPDEYVHFRPLALPRPVHALAISAASKNDQDRLSEALQRITEEDKTFTVTYDPETHETVIAGMGELHINIVLDRVNPDRKMDITIRPPRVAYRETITRNAEVSYRHKKQSGGHGQFGEVHIRVRPLERGAHYQFRNEIKGGSVSRGFVPGIEKGLHEAMEHGVLAGYPVVDVAIALFDGKEHSVDSSEMAFKIAARGALKDAMGKCGPVLLEPIMKLSVFVEEQYLGDILSDLSGKRGRVLGQEQLGGGIIEIDALVPQAELLRYTIDLKSITAGTGSFEVEFDHYEPIAGKIAQEVIANSPTAVAAQVG